MKDPEEGLSIDDAPDGGACASMECYNCGSMTSVMMSREQMIALRDHLNNMLG